MAAEQILREMKVRLETLERKTEEIDRWRQSLVSLAVEGLEYVLLVDGHEVWAGQDLETSYPVVRAQHPGSEISIGWRSAPIVLV